MIGRRLGTPAGSWPEVLRTGHFLQSELKTMWPPRFMAPGVGSDDDYLSGIRSTAPNGFVDVHRPVQR